nr:MAG TPA: Aspartate 1-decarboxylase [Caudoviricetes sp.]
MVFVRPLERVMFLDKENKECFSVYGLVGRS